MVDVPALLCEGIFSLRTSVLSTIESDVKEKHCTHDDTCISTVNNTLAVVHVLLLGLCYSSPTTPTHRALSVTSTWLQIAVTFPAHCSRPLAVDLITPYVLILQGNK